jgi:hypothetical protein
MMLKPKHWPLRSTLGIYWMMVLILVILSMRAADGTMIYPLDDTYIHMAIAKNTALHRVWGVTRHGFTSSTSSPLWTALLSLTYAIFGVSEAAPLALNVLFGTLVIIVAHHFLTGYITQASRIFAILLAVIFVTPLPTLTLTGMEHTLHTLLTLSFTGLTLPFFCTTGKPRRKKPGLLMLLAALLCSTRYEGLFLVFITCVLLLLKTRRVILPIAVGISAWLPLIVYGLWSVKNGWFFLPNSLLLKGHQPSLKHSMVSLLLYHHVAVLLFASLYALIAMYRKREKPRAAPWYLNLLFLGSLLLHLSFASLGWFFRYEAYLVTLGLITLSITFNAWFPDKAAGKRVWSQADKNMRLRYGLLGLIAAFSLGGRAVLALRDLPIAVRSRYLDHIQHARFIERYYPHATIVINDIGAVAFFTQARILDAYGLSSLEPIAYRTSLGDREYTQEDLANWAKQEGAEIALLKTEWKEIAPIIPETWIQVAEWKIPKDIVFGDTRLSIYATDTEHLDYLSESVETFATEHPQALSIRYYDVHD